MSTADIYLRSGTEQSGNIHQPYPKEKITREGALSHSPAGHDVDVIHSINFSVGVDNNGDVDCCNPVYQQHVCTEIQKREDVFWDFLVNEAEVGSRIEIGSLPHLGWLEALWFQTVSLVPGLSFNVHVCDLEDTDVFTMTTPLDFNLDPCDVQTDSAEFLPNDQAGAYSANYVPYSDAWSIVLEVVELPADLGGEECPCSSEGLSFWFKAHYRDSCKIRGLVNETCTSECVPASLEAGGEAGGGAVIGEGEGGGAVIGEAGG